MIWRRAFLGVLAAGNLVLLYCLFFSGQGLFAYLEMKTRHDGLSQKLATTELKSLQLSREIVWLRSDREYLEQTIRAQTNFLKTNEVVYLFPENSPKRPAGAADHEKQD